MFVGCGAYLRKLWCEVPLRLSGLSAFLLAENQEYPSRSRHVGVSEQMAFA